MGWDNYSMCCELLCDSQRLTLCCSWDLAWCLWFHALTVTVPSYYPPFLRNKCGQVQCISYHVKSVSFITYIRPICRNLFCFIFFFFLTIFPFSRNYRVFSMQGQSVISMWFYFYKMMDLYQLVCLLQNLLYSSLGELLGPTKQSVINT